MGSDHGSKPVGLLRSLLRLLPAATTTATTPHSRRRSRRQLFLLGCLLASLFLVCLLPLNDGAGPKQGRRPHSLLGSLVGGWRRRQQQQQQELPQVVVIVTPSPVPNPGTRFDRLSALLETWGQRHPDHVKVLIPTDDVEGESTGLYGDNGGKGASSFSSPSSPFLPRELFFELPAEYGPADNLHRIVSSLQEAARRFPAAAWFMVANEHTYIVPENLLCFLSTRQQQHKAEEEEEPLFLGHRLVLNGDGGVGAFLSGGAGFLLNRPARDRLLQGLTEGKDAACRAASEWARTNAGVVIAQCLASLGVDATSTRGADNKERFHVYGPCRTSEAVVEEWFVQYHPTAAAAAAAVGCCAPDTVSWHYVGPAEARAIACVLYGGPAGVGTGRGRRLRAALPPVGQRLAATQWPRKGEEVGGYARVPSEESPMWETLFETVRVCDLEAMLLASSSAAAA